MGFREVGLDLGHAFGAFGSAQKEAKKKEAIKAFVERQLGRLPPEKAAEAMTLLEPNPEASLSPMPATTLGEGGVSDSAIPPELMGGPMGQGPVDDLFTAPPPDLSGLARPKRDDGEESLRMLLEATRDDVMEPKGLFDYIAGMGKQDMIGGNRMDLEGFKADTRRDLQTADHQARLDRLERLLESREGIADKNIDSREKIAGAGNETRKTIAGQTNATREKIARERPAGKNGKDPDSMTDDEIDAELAVYQSRADSLANAGGDPRKVGYKPAEEKFATVDEAARQKDLSKSMDRVTVLQAAKARKQAGGGGVPAPAPGAAPTPGAAPSGKVYSSKAEIKADLASGVLKPGAKVQYKLPDGSMAIVNTGK